MLCMCGINMNIHSYTDYEMHSDEIEYGIFEKQKRLNNSYYELSLTGAQLRQKLTGIENSNSDLPIGCEWQPEYGSWMVEVKFSFCT